MDKSAMKYLYLVLFFMFSVNTVPVCAEPTTEFVQAFSSAFEAVRQPDMTTEDIDRYLVFMADDVIDHHVAYGVSVEGKEKSRTNLIKKKPNSISFCSRVENIVLGASTAVFVMYEKSEYIKKGKAKKFSGRTIFVLEFNEDGLIQNMRRYLDM